MKKHQVKQEVQEENPATKFVADAASGAIDALKFTKDTIREGFKVLK